MRLATSVQPTEAHNVLAKSNFSVRVSATGFKILSSGLYSDKIRAILREISCNAYDAHVAAGCPTKPIYVKLPIQGDLKLVIQDFGPGLSPEEIAENYTTYFASTKSSSDEFTGAFGLGSKSPFAYVDQFTIVTAKDGRKRTYAAYMNESGIPSCDLMRDDVADPDWPHGVRVEMMTRQQDVQEFQNKAPYVYAFFKTLPDFHNFRVDLKNVYSTKLVYGDTWILRDGQGFGGTSAAHVVCGNVVYPIDWNNVKLKHEHQKIMPNLKGVIMHLPVGSVDIAVSREHLEYTDRTRFAIQEASRKLIDALGAEVYAVFKKTNLRNAKERLALLNNKTVVPALTSGGGYFAEMLKNVTNTVSAMTPLERTTLVEAFTQHHIEAPDWLGHGKEMDAAILIQQNRRNNETVCQTQYLEQGRIWNENTARCGYNVVHFQLRDEFMIAVVTEKGGLTRFRKAVRAGKLPTLIVLNPKLDPAPNGDQTRNDEATKVKNRLLKEWLEVDVLYDTELDDYFANKNIVEVEEDEKIASQKVNAGHASVSLEGYAIMSVRHNRTEREVVDLKDKTPWLYLTRLETLKYVTGALPDGTAWKVDRAYFEGKQMQLAHLLETLKFASRGSTALFTPSEVKKYDPESQGFKPLWTTIAAWMEDPATQKKYFKKNLDAEFLPTINIPTGSSKDHYGNYMRSDFSDLRMMVPEIRKDTELAKVVLAELKGHPTHDHLVRLAKVRFADDLEDEEGAFIELFKMFPAPLKAIHFSLPHDLLPGWSDWLTVIANSNDKLRAQPKVLGVIVANGIRVASDNYVAPKPIDTKDPATP